MGKVMKNSLAGMLANGVYLVSRILLTPFILMYVSLEEFGLWSFCFVIISFAGLSGTGISSAFIKYIAEFHEREDEKKISEILSTGTFVLALVSVVILVLIWGFTPLLLDLFEIKNSGLREIAVFLVRGSVAVFLFDLVLSGFKSLLDGLQEIALSRGIWLASTLLEVGLTVLLLTLGWGIRGVFWGYAGRCFFGSAFYVLVAIKRVSIRFRMSLSALKLLYSFGGKVQILSFIGIFMTSFDRLIIIKMLGLDFAGLFAIGRKFPIMGASVTGAALDSLLPAGSALHSRNRSSYQPVSGQGRRYGQITLLALALGGSVAVSWPVHEWQLTLLLFTEPFFSALSLLLLAIILSLVYNLLNRLFSDDKKSDVSEEMRTLYLRSSLYLNMVNTALFSFLAACSPGIILAWLGPGYGEAALLMSMFSVSVLVNLATGPGTALLRGAGRPECELEYALLNFILAIAWVPVFTHFLELPGAALGTAASTIVASLYFIVRTNRLLGVSFAEYAEQTLYPASFSIMGSAMAGTTLFLLPAHSRWDAVWQVLAAGIFYTLFHFLFLGKMPVFAETLDSIKRRWQKAWS